jgi:hypothetical protein
MIQSSLLGGLFIGVLSALPVVNVANCCCLWITGGGVISAYLAQQENAPPLTARRGALAGLLAGLVGAVVWLFVAGTLDVFIAPLQQRMVDDMVRNARDMPPEVRAWLEQIGSRASAPFRLAAGLFFQLFAGAIFATLGGVVGAAFFRKPVPPPVPDDAVPPPLPPA